MDEYGKRPLWQGVIMYLIVGGLLYGAVYYFWMKPKGSLYTPPVSTEATPYESKVTTKEMKVVLEAENASGQSGTATLVEIDGKVKVDVMLTGTPQGGPAQPAHIHMGACPGVGAVKYPLTSLVGGVSTTTLDVTLDQIKGDLPMAINVHKSAAESSVYTACGALE
jgi:hypothetical protein